MYNQINVQHIKNYFRKPSVLVLTVCKAVTVFISCFLGIFAVGAVNDLLRTLATVSHDADLYEFSSLSVASSIPSVIINSIIALIPAALWLWIYLSAKSNNINRKPDTVFTVNFVFAVLGIVGSAIAIICSGLFFLLGIGMALPYDDMTSSEQEMMSFVSVVFGLILFYATRVGDGKPVKRFSVVTLIIMVLPSLYILLTSLAPTLPLGDTLGNSSIVVCLAGVALGYGIPYTFLSGFEVEREEVEEGNVEGGIMEEIDATDENETDETEELEQNEEVTEDDTPVEDNQE